MCLLWARSLFAIDLPCCSFLVLSAPLPSNRSDYRFYFPTFPRLSHCQFLQFSAFFCLYKLTYCQPSFSETLPEFSLAELSKRFKRPISSTFSAFRYFKDRFQGSKIVIFQIFKRQPNVSRNSSISHIAGFHSGSAPRRQTWRWYDFEEWHAVHQQSHYQSRYWLRCNNSQEEWVSKIFFLYLDRVI